ncbi:unnamed protein product [Victoria cruziana]
MELCNGGRNVKDEEQAEILREIGELKRQKMDIEHRISELEARLRSCCYGVASREAGKTKKDGLTREMIYRYSRHLLLLSFGVQGQSNLLKSSILVVGAGGLGSPAALYVAACGVGCLGLVDHDVVEVNNLHRQVIHAEAYIGKSKVKSAAAACRAINSTVQIREHEVALTTENALEIVSKYDVVIDATDNVTTRYLISDCCVLLGKPLVSGAALGLEGQLTVYNHNDGPCYRCLFPAPPPSAACQRCSDNGVLGVVPGVIGSLQALEAIKIASGVGDSLSRRMLLFDALSARMHIVKIRGKSSHCAACGETAELTFQKFQEFDYEKFTQSPMSDKACQNISLLPRAARISCTEYNERVLKREPHLLLDVRPAHHYKICALPGSLSIPLADLKNKVGLIHAALQKLEVAEASDPQSFSLYVICRRGNDSQIAVESLRSMGFTAAKDIIGGLESWAQDIDPNFPIY